jgi:hypothetical protein|tara:strand:+ start:312 stop:515 length:204 start_codon:yes stop_codon:yes gene_type:complete
MLGGHKIPNGYLADKDVGPGMGKRGDSNFENKGGNASLKERRTNSIAGYATTHQTEKLGAPMRHHQN